MSRDYELGTPYFLYQYYDKEFRYPFVTSLVFIGKNLEQIEEGKEYWFFQDSKSFQSSNIRGMLGKKPVNINSIKSDIDIEVYDFSEDQLDDLLDIKELSDKLARNSHE